MKNMDINNEVDFNSDLEDEFNPVARLNVCRLSLQEQRQKRMEEIMRQSESVQRCMSQEAIEIAETEATELQQTTDSAATSQSNQQTNARSSKKKSRVWTHVEIMKLIALWSETPVLFNVKDPQYFDSNAKKNAVERLVLKLTEDGVNVTVEEVTSKLHSLRVYFGTQRNKVISSKKSGAGTNEVYKVSWPYYEALMFLNDNLTPRTSTSNLQIKRKSSTVPKTTNKRSAHSPPIDQTNELMKEAVDVLRQRNQPQPPHPTPVINELSNDDLFFKMMTQYSKKIPEGPQKDFLKVDIYRLILGAVHDQYASVHSNSSSPFASPPLPQSTMNTSRMFQDLNSSSNTYSNYYSQ